MRPAFRIDHIAIQVRDRQGLVDEIAARTGLPDLLGYSVSGVVQSRGVRFGNGAFLDVFETERPGAALILEGDIHAAQRLSQAQGWAARVFREEAPVPGAPVFPWSMVHFRRGQGLLTFIGVIAYGTNTETWTRPDFSGPLYRAGDLARDAAILRRVWLGAEDLARAEADLRALGYDRLAPVTSAFWPHAGQLLRGQGVDIVLFGGPDGVARIDIQAGRPAATELAWPDAPRLVFDEAA